MHVIVYFGVWKCHVCTSHLCNWMFVLYYTHLVYVKRFCSLGSTQTFYQNELYAFHCTHLDLVGPFLLHFLIENSSSEWTLCHISHTLWSGWPFLLCCLMRNNLSKWTVCRISHTPSSGFPFLLFRLITNSLSEWTVCRILHTPSFGCPFLCSASSQIVNWIEPYALHHTHN